MNKIKIKILESATSKGCKHDHLICNSCGSVITMREPKKFNVKRFIALAKKIRESESKNGWAENDADSLHHELAQREQERLNNNLRNAL